MAFYLLGTAAVVYHLANGLWTGTIAWGLTQSAVSQQRSLWAFSAFGIMLLLLGHWDGMRSSWLHGLGQLVENLDKISDKTRVLVLYVHYAVTFIHPGLPAVAVGLIIAKHPSGQSEATGCSILPATIWHVYGVHIAVLSNGVTPRPHVVLTAGVAGNMSS